MTQQTAPTDPSNEPRKSSAPMRASRIKVRNFRLLRNVDIDLDRRTTVLVGRNNSGKTTLAEAFTRFLQPSTLTFTVADFSAESYPEFLEAWKVYAIGDEEVARSLIPEISLTVEISYSKELPEYGPLAAAIVDLDPDCTTAMIRLTYSLEGGRLSDFFEGIAIDPKTGEEPNVERVLGIIGDRVQGMFGRSITAIDPGDVSNTRDVTLEATRRLLTVHLLKAQRGLDDEKEQPKELIGRVFQNLFDAASNADDGTAQKETADALAEAVSHIEQDLGVKVSEMVKEIIPTLRSFGYPGLADPGLEAETTLDIKRLLGNHTSIRYSGVSGVSLPESYSGLGSRNLILMLLTLLSYYREFVTRGNMPGVHLIFVEEPEAHLHPQMQEVFIEQLASVSERFPALDKKKQPWWPQFAVSTHSSHVANRADFSTIRYFRVGSDPSGGPGHHADVLDLTDAKGLDKKFLHQYLTLTRSDLFFADKAILVEGTSERLIVPAAIRNTKHELSSQYVALMEVGGAYAHIFFPLLDFLHIPTLVITDIDAIGPAEGKSRHGATTVHEGVSTSNATIKKWFPDSKSQAPTALLLAAETEAIIHGNRYLAFQVPESNREACGRTFEDAFLLANPSAEGLTLTGDAKQDEALVREAADALKKSNFALRFAVEEAGWSTPRYIRRGLDWLLDYSVGQDAVNDVPIETGVVVR
ncbi:ATP-dependent nuclease [Pseudoclavibacter sp. VKM Ac-2867]|uniref:ATP-dependent nuclease n=1 Tax=Pseudoclavibacter sp. VKM Ac-2867 TaxID=2783829 RepID=UPI00188C0730|nr:AAA family ATPase [Pseudoclavibacter sp. VKM Ac-2867]MBF4459018.1 AAA family ATPase [Pseudoclavibacter sp. VKM Ac-2867]